VRIHALRIRPLLLHGIPAGRAAVWWCSVSAYVALPGLEGVHLERAAAEADELGRRLTRRLLEPRASISARTGAMETYSPLFCESLANPQPGLFDSPIPAAASPQLLELLDAAGDDGTDLWNL
jgi:hypothetical protein